MKPTPPPFPASAWVPSLADCGLYLHIPFCRSKCGYCDFYSAPASSDQYDLYTAALQKRILFFGERFSRTLTSVYFGGGTPSLLGGDRIAAILKTVKEAFPLAPDAEITLEANPADDLRETLETAAANGVNRLSFGVQSAVAAELSALGRRHTNADVLRSVADAKAAGITNFSLDLMLGIPHQTEESLAETLDFFYSLAPTHISSYLLKIEPNTPFGRAKESLSLPAEETVADGYLAAVESLAAHGYEQYEISNFAKKGYASRHNLTYWTLGEYLGLGPAAHSLMAGKRFYFPRDRVAFENGNEPISDGDGNTPAEYVLLSLRLTAGMNENTLDKDYGVKLTDAYEEFCERLTAAGYATHGGGILALTPTGFLLQNPILTELLDRLGLEIGSRKNESFRQASHK